MALGNPSGGPWTAIITMVAPAARWTKQGRIGCSFQTERVAPATYREYHIAVQRLIMSFKFVLPALVFGILGAMSRFAFQMVETRWQIAVFTGIAMLIELTAPDRQLRPDWARFTANACAAAVAIVAVKWNLEGVSPLVRELLS